MSQERTIIRVTIEYSDGEVRQLTGVDAQKWREAIDASILDGHIHGITFPTFNWTTVKNGSTSASKVEND